MHSYVSKSGTCDYKTKIAQEYVLYVTFDVMCHVVLVPLILKLEICILIVYILLSREGKYPRQGIMSTANCEPPKLTSRLNNTITRLGLR